ncbi:hypothetical protein L1987_02828 [Smallanthus sonchifolius]|uniref:Uncharacterized protein n=1 Tax=Smallanthus sonchifolius TaxID=185202 RepID=A0ACB9K8X4_9ASTR|nr:hypothetical protein L1987_02828 [Smallanthus sonchifolius]
MVVLAHDFRVLLVLALTVCNSSVWHSSLFTDASAFGDTDLELPAVRANRSVVEVHKDLSPNMLSGNNNGWEFNIELPLHAHYAMGGIMIFCLIYIFLFLFHSIILVSAAIGKTRIHTVEGDSHNQSCIFSSTNDGVLSNSTAIIWEVPSGIVKHTTLVSVLTSISAVVGTFAIFTACVLHPEISVYKQS